MREWKKIKEDVIKSMKELGVYHESYLEIIDIYTDLLFQYEINYNEFVKSGCKVHTEYTNKAGATNQRKTPLYLSIEKLRSDISTYSNLLCLNPKSYSTIKDSDKDDGVNKLGALIDSIKDR